MQRDALLKLNGQEQQENLRRRKWDFEREQQTQRVTGGNPAASEELHRQLADIVTKEREDAAKRMQDEMAAIDTSAGKVKLLKQMFTSEQQRRTSSDELVKPPHLATWKRGQTPNQVGKLSK